MTATRARGVRILVAGIQWPPETFLARILRGLPSEGVEVLVSCAGQPDAGWRNLPGLTLLATPAWKGSRAQRIGRIARWSARAALRSPRELSAIASTLQGGVEEVLRRLHRLLPLLGHRPDVVYFPWNHAAVHYEALFDLGVPVVISCRGTQVNVDPHVPTLSHITEDLRRTFAKAAAVHCVSQHILDEARQYGLDPAKARVIRPAVDTRDFTPTPRSRRASGRVRMVTTGALIWRKGIEYLLMALRMLLDRGVDAELVVIGDGKERSRAEFTARDLGVVQHVEMLGRKPPGEVLAELRRADVFVLSSLSEGISNAVLEAMACGVPVVTTDCGGMLEAIQPERDGMVVPVRDPKAMADAIETLARDGDLRRRIGAAGRERVVNHFDLAAQVRQYADLFRSVT